MSLRQSFAVALFALSVAVLVYNIYASLVLLTVLVLHLVVTCPRSQMPIGVGSDQAASVPWSEEETIRKRTYKEIDLETYPRHYRPKPSLRDGLWPLVCMVGQTLLLFRLASGRPHFWMDVPFYGSMVLLGVYYLARRRLFLWQEWIVILLMVLVLDAILCPVYQSHPHHHSRHIKLTGSPVAPASPGVP